MTEERVFGETTIYYIEVKVGGRVLDVVEVWTGCANDPQWLAEMKARFGQLGPGERHAVIKAVRDIAPKIAAQIREELAYAEEGPTKKEIAGYAEAIGASGAGLVRYSESRMPCKFIREAKCYIGSVHFVKGENRKLYDRDVAGAEGELRYDPKITNYVTPAFTDTCLYLRPELLELIPVWHQKAWEKCQENAAPGEEVKKGRIWITSGYRLLGTTCSWDTCGVIDSSDKYGHWSGYAIDVDLGLTAISFKPNLTEDEVVQAAEDAKLFQPHEGEKHHFRPQNEYIRR